jgi:hypothetical protein
VVALQGVYVNSKQPTSLVKFATADSAVRILSQSSLRWSAPSLFKGPFELNHRSNVNFDSKALLIACVKATLGLIFSRDEPSGNSPLIKAVRRWRAEERFNSEDEASDVLSELLSSMVRQREPEMLQIMRDWIKYSSRLRILCLTESHDEPSLWDRYGDGHTGVAIRLATGEDTSLEKPMAVSYSDRKPQISSLKEQMDILMNSAEVTVQEGFEEKFLCKSKSASREKEWRVLRTLKDEPPADNQWFEEVSFQSQEVKAVYFGAAMADDKKAELNTLLARQFPKVKIFQAKAFSDKFELDFERTNPV